MRALQSAQMCLACCIASSRAGCRASGASEPAFTGHDVPMGTRCTMLHSASGGEAQWCTLLMTLSARPTSILNPPIAAGQPAFPALLVPPAGQPASLAHLSFWICWHVFSTSTSSLPMLALQALSASVGPLWAGSGGGSAGSGSGRPAVWAWSLQSGGSATKQRCQNKQCRMPAVVACLPAGHGYTPLYSDLAGCRHTRVLCVKRTAPAWRSTCPNPNHRRTLLSRPCNHTATHLRCEKRTTPAGRSTLADRAPLTTISLRCFSA